MMIKLYRVIAKRTSYEELYIEAENESDAIEQITMSGKDFDWKELDELYWDIDSVEFQTQVKFSSEEQ